MTRYSTEPGITKYIKGYESLSFVRNLSTKYEKKLLDTATRTWLDIPKIVSKKVVHKVAEATGEFIGNKIAEKIVKPKPVPYVNPRNFEELLFHQKKTRNIELIKANIIKWNTIKYLN